MAGTEIPEWLDKKFLSVSLQGGEGSTVEVKKFSASLAAPAGSNYASYVLRVAVDLVRNKDEDRSLSLIIKSPVRAANEAMKATFEELRDIEADFYYQFIPEARKVAKIDFAPKAYFSSVPAVVVLEDLREKGFVMADRHKQLDLNHCKLYAVASATFHAASAAVDKTNPQVLKSIGKEKVFSDTAKCADVYKIWISQGIECVANYMDTTEFKKYSNLVRGVSSNLWSLLVMEFHKPTVLNTLNQGDPWTTNMMFRYDSSGNVCDIKLLDFQYLRYGSPITDIVFFLWCGANDDVRDNSYEDFFHLYCDTLNTKLQELGCSERLTFKELMEGVKKLSLFSLFLISTYLPILVSNKSADMEKFFRGFADKNKKSVNKMAKHFDADYCKFFLLKQFSQMEAFGVFDFLSNSI